MSDALRMPGPPEDSGGARDPAWEQARRRVERKRKFWGDLVAYVVINLLLVGIWLFNGRGYFWPAWVMAPWGVLVLLDAWSVFFRRPITEEDIRKEMRGGGATPIGGDGSPR